MRYLIDITSAVNEKVGDLVRKGRYPSVAAFINSAIENQLYLEESSPGIMKSDVEQLRPVDGQQASSLSKGNSGENYLSLLSSDIRDVQTINPPSEDRIMLMAGKKDSDCRFWVWGQVNRIFPLKFSLRTLGNLLKQNKADTISLKSFKEIVAPNARGFGQKLMEFEKMKHAKRAKRVSAGLPIGEEGFKSEARFKSHFLVTVRTTEEGRPVLDGALAKYMFANVEGVNKEEKIGITKAGLAFAQLENPILDRNEYDFTLSEAEIDYYLRHVTEHVQGEYKAIKLIISIIKKGINRREDINEALIQYCPEWSPEIRNTQRAGLMSRMFELRLLEREPDEKGVGVTYKISKNAEAKIH